MRDLFHSRGGTAAVTALIVLLFLAVRVVLLYARNPFFDEQYTLWMAKHPLSHILPALKLDSGPPLYYFLARIPSVIALRWMSLLFACVPLVMILMRRSLGPARFVAAALLAVYVSAALYATDARSYALCAMFVAVGVLLLDDDRPFAAMVAFVLAAYSQYYGVLFFPLLLTKGRRGIVPCLVSGILFIPGFLLAFSQPREATEWNSFQPIYAPIVNAAFAGRYSPALFARPPLWLIAVAFALLVAAVSRSWRFAPAVLIPIALAVLFELAGRPVYFPQRFESVIAVPLMLWIAMSLQQWAPVWRRGLVVALMAIGIWVISSGIVDHIRRPLDPCAAAALFVERHVPGDVPVVASGYCYLSSWLTFGPRTIADPPEQAEHPGWRKSIDSQTALAATRALPRGELIWIGASITPEFTALRASRRTRVLAAGPNFVIVVRVAGES